MIDIHEHVRRLVAQAPPPTPEQIARLRLIFSGRALSSPANVREARTEAA